MRSHFKTATIVALGLLLPFMSQAQAGGGGMAGNIESLQQVLDKLYQDMMPLCTELIGIGRAIAGFAATWYIAARVWKHIARAEPIDFYALARPFLLNIAIFNFGAVVWLMNGVMQPTVTATASLADHSNETVKVLLGQKEKEMQASDEWKALVGESGTGNRELWLKYAHPEVQEEGWMEGLGNDMEFIMDKMAYNFKNEVRRVLSVVLEIIYAAAALCINTLRTFNLVILCIIGPLVFGISVFDGFQHALTTYLARFVNVFLWLPVANILSTIMGKIQENMIKMDLSQIAAGHQTFFNSYDLGYMIFMIIGIIGYTTVPGICDQIIHVGGGGSLQHRVTQMTVGNVSRMGTMALTGGMGAAAAGYAGGGSGMAGDAYGDGNSNMTGGTAAASGSGNYFRNKVAGGDA